MVFLLMVLARGSIIQENNIVHWGKGVECDSKTQTFLLQNIVQKISYIIADLSLSSH